MTNNTPTTDDIIDFTKKVIVPLLKLDRTMVMPFDTTRHENVGEHSFSLGMLAGALAEQIDPTLDTSKIAQFSLAHDVVEAYAGDMTVWESDTALAEKSQIESLAADKMATDFPMFPWAIRTFHEYEMRDTPEKRFVYALDKIYPHILIIIADHHPVHPSWEAYKRTEDIAHDKIKKNYPLLLPLFEDLCATFRQKPHFFSTDITS